MKFVYIFYIYIYLEPKLTLVLIRKGLVFEGPIPKTKDKWVSGVYIYI